MKVTGVCVSLVCVELAGITSYFLTNHKHPNISSFTTSWKGLLVHLCYCYCKEVPLIRYSKFNTLTLVVWQIFHGIIKHSWVSYKLLFNWNQWKEEFHFSLNFRGKWNLWCGLGFTTVHGGEVILTSSRIFFLLSVTIWLTFSLTCPNLR